MLSASRVLVREYGGPGVMSCNKKLEKTSSVELIIIEGVNSMSSPLTCILVLAAAPQDNLNRTEYLGSLRLCQNLKAMKHKIRRGNPADFFEMSLDK